jgi:hypothetical protein
MKKKPKKSRQKNGMTDAERTAYINKSIKEL